MIERDETELPAEHACRVQRRLRHSHNRYWKRGARGPQTGVERHGNKSRIEVLIVLSQCRQRRMLGDRGLGAAGDEGRAEARRDAADLRIGCSSSARNLHYGLGHRLGGVAINNQ